MEADYCFPKPLLEALQGGTSGSTCGLRPRWVSFGDRVSVTCPPGWLMGKQVAKSNARTQAQWVPPGTGKLPPASIQFLLAGQRERETCGARTIGPGPLWPPHQLALTRDLCWDCPSEDTRGSLPLPSQPFTTLHCSPGDLRISAGAAVARLLLRLASWDLLFQELVSPVAKASLTSFSLGTRVHLSAKRQSADSAGGGIWHAAFSASITLSHQTCTQ